MLKYLFGGIREDLHKWKGALCSWRGQFNNLNMPITLNNFIWLIQFPPKSNRIWLNLANYSKIVIHTHIICGISQDKLTLLQERVRLTSSLIQAPNVSLWSLQFFALHGCHFHAKLSPMRLQLPGTLLDIKAVRTENMMKGAWAPTAMSGSVTCHFHISLVEERLLGVSSGNWGNIIPLREDSDNWFHLPVDRGTKSLIYKNKD